MSCNELMKPDGSLDVSLTGLQAEHSVRYTGNLENPFETLIQIPAPDIQTLTIRSIITSQQDSSGRYYYPPNQRNPAEGWTHKNKEGYIISILERTHLNLPWILNLTMDADGCEIRSISDGGHRYYTVCLFVTNKLKVRGRLWKNYTKYQQNLFLNASIAINTYTNLSKDHIQRMMTIVNTHLNMSRGERANTYSMNDKWAMKSSKFLEENDDIRNQFYSMFGKNSRNKYADMLGNIAIKYVRNKRNMEMILIGENFCDFKQELNDYYEHDYDTCFDELKQHIHILSEVFKKVEKKFSSKKFDIFVTQQWIMNGIINDTQSIEKASEFFEKVFNFPGDPLYKQWHAHKSGHGKNEDKYIAKTAMIEKYFENNST